MKPHLLLHRALEHFAPHFEPGGRLQRWYPLWEAVDTFFLTPPTVTTGTAHVRDALNLKRMMILVVIATIPCMLMAMFNTGLQANLALDPAKTGALEGWRHAVLRLLGAGYSPDSLIDNLAHGSMYFVPLYAVTMIAGLGWEILFSIVRKVEVNEGFFVTGALFPLILPATTPLWMAALGISFGVVLAKEVFGGTGMNFVNPALASRAFLFFAFPAAMTGDRIWTAVPPGAAVDGFSGATMLGELRTSSTAFEATAEAWWRAFIGLEPGSMGETSALACLIGALILVVTGIGSWRTMVAVALGTIGMAQLFNAFGSAANPWSAVPFWWHMVMGGWAFAMAFMATDPVTSPFSNAGKWVYGIGIGALIVLVRVVNPAYPEAVMLVILFMNVMAPLIDHGFVRANIRRRQRRLATGPAGGSDGR